MLKIFVDNSNAYKGVGTRPVDEGYTYSTFSVPQMIVAPECAEHHSYCCRRCAPPPLAARKQIGCEQDDKTTWTTYQVCIYEAQEKR